MAIKVFHVDRDFVEVPIVEGAMSARVVVWPGVGAKHLSMHYISYERGQASVPHFHPHSEDCFYIVSGEGTMAEWRDDRIVSEQEIGPGSVVYVEPNTIHQVRARTPLVNVGGPCPPDLDFYRRLGLKI